MADSVVAILIPQLGYAGCLFVQARVSVSVLHAVTAIDHRMFTYFIRSLQRRSEDVAVDILHIWFNAYGGLSSC